MTVLSDEARNRLFIATTDKDIGTEIADLIDAGAGGLVEVTAVDLASTANGDGASLVGVEDAGGYYTAANVEAALAEVKVIADAAMPTATLALTTSGNGASKVGIYDTAGYYAATTVEAALAEVMKYVPLEIADPGDGAAIPVTRSATINITTAAAETNTLAIPTFLGQVLVLNMDTRAVGDRVVTSAQAINQAGNTIMTFGAARDNISLRAITVGGALRWTVVHNDGVALS